MRRTGSQALSLAVALLSATACELVLGLEDHELLPASTAEGGSGGVGGVGGDGGAGAGTAGLPEAGSAGASGEAGGGEGGSSAGQGGAAGSAGEGGSGPVCELCAIGALLAHRYTFDGIGTEATDSVGTAHATLAGPALDGSGAVTLSGTDQYVDLPNQLVSSLDDASFEVWLTWDGTSSWERVFDFGDETDSVEDAQSLGRTYLFLTPSAGVNGNPIRAVYSVGSTAAEVIVNSTATITAGELTQLVVVVDGTALRLYRNGVSEGFAGPIGPLSAINDINNWLGRSQFAVDPELSGTVHDFRIYSAALSAEQVALLYDAGADTIFGE